MKRYWRYYSVEMRGHVVWGGSEVFEAFDRQSAVWHATKEMCGEIRCRMPRYTRLWETDADGTPLPTKKGK